LEGKEYSAVWDRHDELLDRHAAAWVFPFVGPGWSLGPGWASWRWRRGFPEGITLAPPRFVSDAGNLFAVFPITQVSLVVYSGGMRREMPFGGLARVLYDADMTRRGGQGQRIPGAVFAFLDKVGLSVRIRRAKAVPAEGVDARELLARACVAYGRKQAGLEPLRWT
jgi:hypothetical protein